MVASEARPFDYQPSTVMWFKPPGCVTGIEPGPSGTIAVSVFNYGSPGPDVYLLRE
jgi:hypothetical protein